MVADWDTKSIPYKGIYRALGVYMVFLMLVGSIESGRWWGITVMLMFGFIVWRAAIPTGRDDGG